jgi:hypothetical protein
MTRIRGGRAGWTAAAAACLAAYLSVSTGCGAFDTRTPVEGEGEETIWQPPTTPQITIQNLELAFESKIFNDYRRALTEDFFFRPDNADSFQISLDRPGVPVYVNWNKDVEGDTAGNIAADADSISLFFATGTEEIIGEDRLLKKTYELRIVRAADVPTYVGEAWFWVREVANGEWYIYRWEDIRTTPPPAVSWGYHKGQRRL